MAAISGTTAAVISAVSIAASLAGTAMSMSAQQRQAQAQQAQASYQAKVAEKNQELATEQAKAARKEGYDAAVRKRQEVAGIIGSQRAVAGASGATVDSGSFLDLNMDTAEKGEMDALSLYQQGLDKARNLEIQGWNSGQQAQAYAWQADRVDPTAGMIGTALGGIAQAGSNFGSGLWGGSSKTLDKNTFDTANSSILKGIGAASGTKGFKV